MTPMALALRHGHVKCVEILLSTGSLMSDPMMTWLSQQFNTGNAIWYAYAPEMIKLLLVCPKFFLQESFYKETGIVLYEAYIFVVLL